MEGPLKSLVAAVVALVRSTTGAFRNVADLVLNKLGESCHGREETALFLISALQHWQICQGTDVHMVPLYVEGRVGHTRVSDANAQE